MGDGENEARKKKSRNILCTLESPLYFPRDVDSLPLDERRRLVDESRYVSRGTL
jgi:hypothetical protein